MIVPLLIALQAVSTPRRKKPLPQEAAPGTAP
jgi:hypothetical protein